MEIPPRSIPEEILKTVRSQLDGIKVAMGAKELSEKHLREFTIIAHSQIINEAKGKIEKISQERDIPESELPQWQEHLIYQTTRLFTEGFIQSIIEVSQTELSPDHCSSILMNTAMHIYEKAYDLTTISLKETGLKATEPDSSVSAIQIHAQMITQECIKHFNEDEAIRPPGKAAKDAAKSSEAEAEAKALTSPPPQKGPSPWQEFQAVLSELWQACWSNLKHREETQNPTWVIAAIFGPFLYWYWVPHYFSPEVAQYAMFLPVVAFFFFFAEPLIKKGLFHLTASRLLLVAVASTLTVQFGNRIPSGILISVWVALLAFLVLEFMATQDMKEKQTKLEESKEAQKETINPNLMYEKLGVDAMSLQVGNDLLPLVDPAQGSQFLTKVVKLRETLTNDLGYILPNIRIMDSANLGPNEFYFSVRNGLVVKGNVYPDRYSLPARKFKEQNIPVPANVIIDTHPVNSAEELCWLNAESFGGYQIEAFQKEALGASELLIQSIRIGAIRSARQALTLYDMRKLLELIKHSPQPQHTEDLIPAQLSLSDLHRVISNLIRESVSIKDILLVFERLLDYSRFEKRADLLSEKLRLDFRHHICLQVADKKNNIYIAELSPAWEKVLSQHLQETDYGWEITIDGATKFQLVLQITSILNKVQSQFGRMPVILCSPAIRLPLFRLLSDDLPDITILASSELAPGFTQAVTDTIEPIS